MKRKNLLALSMGIMALCLSAASNAASWSTNSLGGFSSVHIYNPTTESPVGTGKSLLIVLHGCTQSIDAFKTANLEDAADEYGMIVAVPDAMNKAGFSCWSYWQGTKSRSSGDYKNVIDLATAIRDNASYDVDAAQVYVAGLSSGGAFAMTVGCLAPDIFAGMGLDAAPSTGTSSNGAFSLEGSPSSVAASCQSYAGSYASYFDTQITNTAYGTSDYTVPQGYGPQNADAMAIIYGVSKLSGTNAVQGISGAQETMYTDGRISMVSMSGVGHAWPGGSGASGSYIDGSSINYGKYLAKYFSENNPRLGPPPPVHQAEITDAAVDAPMDGTTATVTAAVEVPVTSTLISIDVTVDSESRSISSTSINEVFTVNQGDHTATITVTVQGDDGENYVTTETMEFNNLTPECTTPEQATGTATEHYVAGRLDVNGYLAMGSKYGYIDSFTLYNDNGTWTDVNPCP